MKCMYLPHSLIKAQSLMNVSEHSDTLQYASGTVGKFKPSCVSVESLVQACVLSGFSLGTVEGVLNSGH